MWETCLNVSGKLEWSAEYAIYHHLPVVVSKLNDCSSKPVRERHVRLGIHFGTCDNSSEASWVQQPGRFHPTGNFHQQTGRFSNGKNPVKSPGATGWFVGHSGFPWPKILQSLGIKGIIIYIYNTMDNTTNVDFWSCDCHGYHPWSKYHTCRLSMIIPWSHVCHRYFYGWKPPPKKTQWFFPCQQISL